MSFWRDWLGMGSASVAEVSAFAGATDIGCKRKQNQDGWSFGPTAAPGEVRQNHAADLRYPGWVAVADGMGGAKGGDVASRRALEIVGDELGEVVTGGETEALARMETALRNAHGLIEAESVADPNLRGMGCTFSGLWWPTAEPLRAVLGQVGDSRVYLWRDGALQQLTRDQTVVQRLIDQGDMTEEEAKRARFSSVLEFALGADGGDLEPEVRWLELRPDDVLLLCSDGLHGVVPDAELARLLPSKRERALPPICQRLIEAARAAGGPDNITAVLVRVGEARPD